MQYMLPAKVIEATSRNEHKRSLDEVFCVYEKVIEGLSETEGRQMGPEVLL